MNNQKLDNSLNLSLQLPEEERQQSAALMTGFDPQTRTWELIIRYNGSLEALRERGITVDELLGQYAVATVPEPLVDWVGSLPQVIFVEKPERLFFVLQAAKSASCINYVQEDFPGGMRLTGRGVLTAVLDSGIDIMLGDFRNADGSTRIEALWDQNEGRVYLREELNEILAAQEELRGSRTGLPGADYSGHGTAVAGIAAGNGTGCRGIAYESDILAVKLGTPSPDGFPRTTELMRAVDFAVRFALEQNRPLVINISFGNTYGSHDGTGLLETFLNDISGLGQITIVVGSGNEGAAAGHAAGRLFGDSGTQAVLLSVSDYETSFSVQLWKSYEDRFRTALRTPSGTLLGPFSEDADVLRYRYGNTSVYIYYGKPRPYSTAQELYIDFIPDAGSYVPAGIWQFELSPLRIVTGWYDLWLAGAGTLNEATRFLEPAPETTLTIPSTAAKVITVGAYDASLGRYADFSGRGFTRAFDLIKPDIAAPGVNILAPAAGGGCLRVTGTSFAAPIVSGSVALMMQWGIVDGNDPFLYGEKAKAYLRRGARQLPGFSEWPNPQLGYGALCLRDSFPEV